MLSRYASMIVLVVATSILAAQSPSRDVERRVTVIGCVKRSPIPGTIGVEPPTPTSMRYNLVNVTLSADADQGVASDVIAEQVPMYRLDDAVSQTVAAHVGQKVEITGTVLPATKPTPEGNPATELRSPPVLRVEKLREIATASTSCAQ